MKFKNFIKALFSISKDDKKLYITVLGIKIKQNMHQKTIAVMRLDGIGDYLLMHNFLTCIKNSKKYKNYKLVFIGRTDFASLSESLDYETVDEFIWLNPIKYLKKKYQKEFIQNLSSYNFDVIVNPAFTRTGVFTENILSKIKAKEVIGHIGCEKVKDSRHYTRLIKTTDDLVFEFDRNKEFFEKLIEEKIEIEKSTIQYPLDMNKKYIFISPFSGSLKRTWSKEHFAEVINYLTKNYNYECVILGSKLYDIEKTTELIHLCKYKEKIINMAGKISLNLLPIYLKNCCKLLIANETGTVHIAKAVNCPFLVISNGSFYNRFQPYKDFEMNYIYPENFYNILSKNKDVTSFYKEIDLNINEIKSENILNSKIIDKYYKKVY